ncbi:MAG: hypothetical protein M3N19_02815 [Candidatus Eremiobacteraeota bacterium]|nr:hypothetical protein [Candidatus Eremiobacteraeota bacterium]
MSRIVFVIALLLAAGMSPALSQNPSEAQLPPQPAVKPAWMPHGALMLSPCVQGMGEHWGAPKTLPYGPIYGVMKGKPVFVEVMISQKDFADGKSFREALKPLPGTRIDHVDIEFEPHGHHGFAAPHYDVHGYFVAHNVHGAFCPDGIPNTTSP